TNMLRDGAPWFAPDEKEKSLPWFWRLLGLPWQEPKQPKQPRAPFSLARVQIAFWFLLIIGGFCYLRLVLGEAPSVNNSARILMAAWTLALGILFLFDLTRNLSMPEFSAALLGLMGISAGTYAGLKTAEQNSVPK